ncbi:hypothetical protein [Paractinoplanes brasiliensis]|nr:hypothetical protein [Actinoplanes brasiliensis]
MLLATMAVGGCGADRSGYVIDPIEQVTYAAGFGPDGIVQEADEKGFYGDAGIDVDVRTDISTLSSGPAQFSALNLAEMLRDRDTFAGWRVIAALDQQNSDVLIVRDDLIAQDRDLVSRFTTATLRGRNFGRLDEKLVPAEVADFGFVSGS